MKQKLRRVKRVDLRRCDILYPSNFVVEKILNTVKGKNNYKRNLEDAMYYILHLLIKFQFQKDKQEEYEQYGFYNLNATLLKKICGNEYQTALFLLENAGVIERKKSYHPGGFSKGCRLSANFNSSPIVNKQLSACSNVNQNYLKRRDEVDQKNEAELKDIAYVTKWYDKKRLTVDIENVHNVLEFYRHKLLQKSADGNSEVKQQQIDNIINYRYNNARESLDKIRRGEFHLTRSGEDNRLHSSITSLKKEFRPFLRFDGQPLVGIDIKASQPYLLTQLLCKDIYKCAATRESNIQSIYGELYNRQQEGRTIMFPSYDKLIDSKAIMNKSISRFHQIDWTKDFYTHLMKLEVAVYGFENRFFIDRNTTKHSIMIILYSKSKDKKKYAAFKRFKELFPLEGELIDFFNKISNEDNKNYLPILMQRLESYLMLNEVCKEISEICPNAPLIPIHDSILTTPEYVDRVKEIIEFKLESLTGIKPGLKIENISDAEISDNLNDLVANDFKEILTKVKKNLLAKSASKEPLLMRNPTWMNEILLSNRYFVSENLLSVEISK